MDELHGPSGRQGHVQEHALPQALRCVRHQNDSLHLGNSIQPSAGSVIGGSPSLVTTTRKRSPPRGASISTILPMDTRAAAAPFSNSMPNVPLPAESSRTNNSVPLLP